MVKFKAFLCCFSQAEPELPNPPLKPSAQVSSPLPITPPQSSLTLTLQVVESLRLPADTLFRITTTGLHNGRRGVRDGNCYFGSALMRTKSPGNDYVWPEAEEGLGAQHFAVKFDRDRDEFIVVDMGEGNGTFMRVREWRPFQQKAVISFEETHTLAEQLPSNKLSIQVVEGPNAGQTYLFSAEAKVIFIGRMADCRVCIEDCQSRYLAAFKFDSERGWLVADGDGKRPSTFGVWLFVDKGVTLNDECEFKVGQTRFKASLSRLCRLYDIKRIQ